MKEKLKVEYHNAVVACKYRVARRLLQILRFGDIELDLSDVDSQVEAILNRCGAKLVYVSNRTGYATYRIM
jgi:hypothetical protein